jgi:hypothetical protein
MPHSPKQPSEATFVEISRLSLPLTSVAAARRRAAGARKKRMSRSA